MKTSIPALLIAVALAACAPQPRAIVYESPRAVVYEAPRAVSSKRIVVVGDAVTLPDGSQTTMDRTGGFDLPNGDWVSRDSQGGLLLPNGNRCLPDRGGFICP